VELLVLTEDIVQRRQFIAFLLGIAGAALWPLRARAQNPPDPAAADDNAIGQVATVQGAATVTRCNAAAAALKVNDSICKNDVLATGANASLGVTFDDETTFNLSANARIVVDEFVYQEGAAGNKAAFNVTRGTVAFIASLVAKNGDMKISTPTAVLGIRGTTGVIDVPADAAGGEAKIKLYADADGRTGQIEVFNRQGGRLGALTQGASAFALRAGAGGRIFAAPFAISPQEAARDRGVVQRLFASHTIGRRMAVQRRQLRGPNFRRPRGPQQNRNLRGPQQPNRAPAQPQRGGFREKSKKVNPFNGKRNDGRR
jgi:hypothetical protein